MTISVKAAVDRLMDSRSSVRSLSPLSAEGEFSLERAYEIQDALRGAFIRRGKRPIGWKLAATGPTGQALLGVQEPIYGFLPAEIYQSGAEVSAGAFVSLHVEAEFAFKLGSDLAGPGATAATARQAIESVAPALELPDAFFSGSLRVHDAVANSVLAKAIMLGQDFTPVDALDLAAEEVVFEHNGQVVSVNTGAELMGDPLNALAWLADKLAESGHKLERGDIVMSGAVSKLLPAQVGETFAATYSRLGTVQLKVVA